MAQLLLVLHHRISKLSLIQVHPISGCLQRNASYQTLHAVSIKKYVFYLKEENKFIAFSKETYLLI